MSEHDDEISLDQVHKLLVVGEFDKASDILQRRTEENNISMAANLFFLGSIEALKLNDVAAQNYYNQARELDPHNKNKLKYPDA